MMMKRVALLVGAVLLVAVAGIAYYFIQLTAPVPVSQTVPVAPTLAVPPAASQAPAAGQAAARAGTPAAGQPGFPPGTPGTGRRDLPRGGFPPGSPPPGGFPPGDGPPGMGAAPVSTSPPAAPTLAAPAAGSAQIYRIDATHSQASYSVSETFLQAFAGMQPGDVTTVGTTHAIAGDILVDRTHPAASQVGVIVIDLSQLKSDISMRDNAIRRQWLESAQYPLATFKNATLSGLPAAWPAGQPVPFQIAGDLTVHGTTQHVTWDATATLTGTTLQVQATTQITMSQFGVQAPSLPMLSVTDPVKVTLNLVATPPGA